MIRIDNRAEIARLGWTVPRLFTGRYAIRLGKTVRPERWRTHAIEACRAAQENEPVAMLRDGRRTLWLFRDRFYWESEGLERADVKALVRRREQKNTQVLQSAHSLMRAEGAGKPVRVPIPTDVRRAVFERDGGRCCGCDSRFDIQYDHTPPTADPP